MRLTHTQKSGLRMLRSGHKPRKATLDALVYRGLAENGRYAPRLTPAGEFYAKHGGEPPNVPIA